MMGRCADEGRGKRRERRQNDERKASILFGRWQDQLLILMGVPATAAYKFITIKIREEESSVLSRIIRVALYNWQEEVVHATWKTEDAWESFF